MSAATSQPSSSPEAAPIKRKRGRPKGSRNAPKPPAPSASSISAPPTFTFDTGVSLLLTAITLPITAAMSAYAESLQQQLKASTPSEPPAPPKKRRKRTPRPVPSSSPSSQSSSLTLISGSPTSYPQVYVDSSAIPGSLQSRTQYIIASPPRPTVTRPPRKAKAATTPPTPVPRAAPAPAADDSATEDEDDGLPVAHVGPAHPPSNPAVDSSPRRSSPRNKDPPTPSKKQSKRGGAKGK